MIDYSIHKTSGDGSRNVSNDMLYKHSSMGIYIPRLCCCAVNFHPAAVDISIGLHDGPTLVESLNL